MKIEDVKQVEIGKIYNVCCLWCYPDLCSKSNYWIPILGPPHADDKHVVIDEKDVGILHFHVDYRFVTQQEEKVFNWNFEQHDIPAIRINDKPEMLLYRREDRKCLRQFHRCRIGAWIMTENRAIFEKRFEGKRLVCNRCPHQNFDMTQVPIIEGIKVCPGHRLSWDAKTGEYVPPAKTPLEF